MARTGTVQSARVVAHLRMSTLPKLAATPAAADSVSKTLTEAIFNRIQADILRCRLKPGDKLRVNDLRLLYGAGGSPVREALSRLSTIGLVHAEGQRGFAVAQVSTADLLDLTKVRIQVETMVLRSAIRNGDRDWEAEIYAAAHRLGSAPPITNGALDANFERRHRAFHAALVRGCNSPLLMAYRDHLSDLSDRYRHLSVAAGTFGRNPAKEHRSIMAAVLKRDADKAGKLVAEHFLETARIVLVGISATGVAEAKAMIEKLRAEVA